MRNVLNFTVVTLKMRKDAYFLRKRVKTRESPQLYYRGHTKNVQGCLKRVESWKDYDFET